MFALLVRAAIAVIGVPLRVGNFLIDHVGGAFGANHFNPSMYARIQGIANNQHTMTYSYIHNKDISI